MSELRSEEPISPRAGDDDFVRRAACLVGRGARLRCPHCGSRGVFSSWLRMREACPTCGLKLDRGEEDYFLGAYTVNFVAAELILVVFLLLVVLVTWPASPWGFIQYGGIILMILAPFVFFPFSRTLWLAIDLAFRPPMDKDFETGPVEA